MKYNDELYEISADMILLKKKLLDEIEKLKEEVLSILIQGFKREYENEELTGIEAINTEVLSLKFVVGEPEFIKIDKLISLGVFDSFALDYYLSLEKDDQLDYIINWDYKAYFDNIYDLDKEKSKKLIK